MAGIFQGLEVAKRALLSQQYTLMTIGHNIANASTPGYSRQRVNLVTTDPLRLTVGMMGTGVRVASVRQVRDLFLTDQFRRGNEQLGRWDSLQRALGEVENILREPSDIGLNAVLSEFFAAWHALSQNPESTAARSAVREQATTMANMFHQLSRRLSDLERELDQGIGGKVDRINQLAVEVTQLNLQIARTEVSGKAHANDLRDRRDLLIDQLSLVANVTALESRTGQVRVFLGTMEIVGEGTYNPLATRTGGAGALTHRTIVWKQTTLSVELQGGELAGLMEARDELVPAYRGMLDDLAAAIVTQVNALHLSGTGLDGTTGHNFFDPAGVTAATIGVGSDVRNDLGNIAASQSGAVGDNANALAIGNLQDALTLNQGTTTFSDFYAEIVSSAGRRSAEAIDGRTNADLVVQQIEFSRQSVQGVSLDEEMANLIQAQHAFDAAARVIATVDQVLDTLINGMGIGR